MLNFQYSSLIKATRQQVWEFHERPDILELLTPPWQPVKIIRREGGLEVGAISEFRIMLLVISVPWIAEHIECQKDQVFVDRQTTGPMKSWLHRHQLSDESGQTRLIDSIEYEIPGSWLSGILLGWWINSRLKEMFRYRHQVTKEYCEGKN